MGDHSSLPAPAANLRPRRRQTGRDVPLRPSSPRPSQRRTARGRPIPRPPPASRRRLSVRRASEVEETLPPRCPSAQARRSRPTIGVTAPRAAGVATTRPHPYPANRILRPASCDPHPAKAGKHRLLLRRRHHHRGRRSAVEAPSPQRCPSALVQRSRPTREVPAPQAAKRATARPHSHPAKAGTPAKAAFPCSVATTPR